MASEGVIRDAAASLFLEQGYSGTSMDEIASAAQVSKQTIYTHFANKEDLFARLVLGNADRVDEFVATISQMLSEPADLEASLRRLAVRYLRFVVRPEVLRLRRLIIGEATRFPDLARQYYELVPGRVYAALAQSFGELRDKGRLRLDDPATAASHFAWLTLGEALDRGMFYPVGPVSRELDKRAAAAVHVFMAAYAT